MPKILIIFHYLLYTLPMQGQNDLVQCQRCAAHIFTSVFEIHRIMCKAPKQKKGFFSSIFQQKKQEEPMIPCTECGNSVPFSTYAIHQTQCIGYQLTLCKVCGIKFPTFLFQEHRGVCEGKNLGIEEEEYQEEQEQLQEQQAGQLQGMIQSVAITKMSNEEGLTKMQVDSLKTWKVEKQQDCPICCTLMRKKQKHIKLNCSHGFHNVCIGSWLAKNPLCPMCRTHALMK